jgi:hypothetical protein
MVQILLFQAQRQLAAGQAVMRQLRLQLLATQVVRAAAAAAVLADQVLEAQARLGRVITVARPLERHQGQAVAAAAAAVPLQRVETHRLALVVLVVLARRLASLAHL